MQVCSWTRWNGDCSAFIQRQPWIALYSAVQTAEPAFAVFTVPALEKVESEGSCPAPPGASVTFRLNLSDSG